MKRLIALLVLSVPAGLAADEVYLRGGGVLSGEIARQTASSLVLEIGAGEVTLPLSRVEKVVRGASDLQTFRTRSRGLAQNDAEGWLDLARWAEARQLHTQSRDAYEHVLGLDPQNAAAHRALGDAFFDGHWGTREENYRARGYVFFEGEWISPEAQRALLAERAEQAAADRALAEAQARVREAEAKARAAEADAQRAEAELKASSMAGIPIGYVAGSIVYGSGVFPPVYGPVVGGYGSPSRCQHGPTPFPVSSVATQRPPMRDHPTTRLPMRMPPPERASLEH